MAVFIIVGVVVAAVVLLGVAPSIIGSATGGTTLNAQQIAGYAANAGFSGPDLQVAVAVALAESSGNTGAVGDLLITPGGSIGLWQINLKAHPEYTAAQLTDPQANANAAYAIYSAAGSTFSPWSTYTNGAYSAYIVTAQQGVNA
jgi:Lysozyme like domain